MDERKPKLLVEECRGHLVPASGLSPAREYDYLAVREITLSSFSDAAQPDWSVRSEVGEPCAEASDKTACESALSAPPVDCVRVLDNRFCALCAREGRAAASGHAEGVASRFQLQRARRSLLAVWDRDEIADMAPG